MSALGVYAPSFVCFYKIPPLQRRNDCVFSLVMLFYVINSLRCWQNAVLLYSAAMHLNGRQSEERIFPSVSSRRGARQNMERYLKTRKTLHKVLQSVQFAFHAWRLHYYERRKK